MMAFDSSLNEDVTRTRINNIIVPGRKKKVFRVKYTNKLKGALGETDLEKGTIRINKAAHKRKNTKLYRSAGGHKKRYPELADTKYHEFMHVKHPKMWEKTIRKKTRKFIKRATKKQKQKLYRKDSIVQNFSTEHK